MYYFNFQDRLDYDERLNLFIYLIAIINPLLFFPNLLSFADIPRVVFLAFIMLLALIIVLLRVQKGNAPRLFELNLIILYFSLLVASTFASKKLLNSIVGSSPRYEGLIVLFLYITIFYLSVNKFKYNKRYFYLFTIIVFFLSIYGVVQFLEYDPVQIFLPWYSFKGRAHSTFGNPNFFGSYLTLVLPILYFSYIKTGKLFFLAISCTAYLALLLTFTRSSWIGAFIGFAIITFYTNKFMFSKLNYVILFFMFALITLITDFQTEGIVLSRFESIQYDTARVLTREQNYELAGANRIFIWKRVIDLIMEKPVLGHGIETLGDVFSERYMDEIIELSGRRIVFDKAHNEYLHIAYSTGIPSLIVYLIFVSRILVRAIKAVKSNHLIIPILAAVIGYLVQAFFNISIVSVAYIYWIFLGILINSSLCSDDNKQL